MHKVGEAPVYVAISEVAVVEAGAERLEAAFADRLRLVERAPGFLDVEVLRDRRRSGRYLMVSHWTSRRHFLDYMKSAEHELSHARIDRGPEGPSAAGFSDFDRVEI
jgi:heme-degrading monooxygenase HmoA